MNFHQPPQIYTGEISLKVTDLDKLISFYTRVIGFKLLEVKGNQAILSADGQHPLLILEQPENVLPKESGRTGLYHFALLLPTRKDLGKAIKHFAKNHIPLGAADHLVSKALYLNDPDGNGIEIYCDRNPSTWKWQNGLVEMATDQLDANAIIGESGDEEWDGLPTGTVMGHVHLHVSDLRTTQSFYEALGFNIVSHYPQALFMSTGNYHHHLGLNTWNGTGASRPSEESAGLQAYTLIYPDRETLEATIRKIEDLGGEVLDSEGNFFTEDPAGNGIILRISDEID